MTPKNKWTEFPSSYRQEEVVEILRWVGLGESGIVIGGSGTGKSNIAGYIDSRPDIRGAYLPKPDDDYLFLRLDLNGLPGVSTSNFYRTMLMTLQDDVADMPEIASVIEATLTSHVDRGDPLTLYLALQRVHRYLIEKRGKQVVWILDRFEECCQQLEATTLNSLRSLRDQFKDQHSYIIFSRRPLAELRNPSEYDELHELLVMHTCWVGTMLERDAQWVAEQVMNRYQTTFSDFAIGTLFELCGGMPSFLKIAYSALANGELPMKAPKTEWQERLLALPALQRSCEEIWDSCTEDEQNILLALAQRESEVTLDDKIANWLTEYGLLKLEHDEFRVFSPLFEAFLLTLKFGDSGISILAGDVYRNGRKLPKSLAKLEFRLLAALVGPEGTVEGECPVFTHDQLINAVWPEQQYVGTEQANLTSLVRNLRNRINQNGHEYIRNVRGRGYQFVQLPQAVCTNMEEM